MSTPDASVMPPRGSGGWGHQTPLRAVREAAHTAALDAFLRSRNWGAIAEMLADLCRALAGRT